MKVVIFGNKHRKEVAEYTKKLVAHLKQKNCTEFSISNSFKDFLSANNVDTSFATEIYENTDYHADFAFSVGGDGTFIKAAAKIGKKETPLLGINAGRLGFLADVHGDEIEAAVNDIVEKRYEIERRALLRLHTDEKIYTDFNYAINELAVLKQDSSAMITIHAWVNGQFLNSYQADGLLIATATGSTAYSMSVGGPIVVPQANNFIINPVAPHTLNMRPLIIPDSWEIELQVESRNGHFLIALDGRNNVFDVKTKLRVSKASFCTNAVKRQGNNFFSTMREKLMWGMDNRRYNI